MSRTIIYIFLSKGLIAADVACTNVATKVAQVTTTAATVEDDDQVCVLVSFLQKNFYKSVATVASMAIKPVAKPVVDAPDFTIPVAGSTTQVKVASSGNVPSPQ